MAAVASLTEEGCVEPDSPQGAVGNVKWWRPSWGAVTLCCILFGSVVAVGEVCRHYGLRETRPTCAEGEDPTLRDCLPAAQAVDWRDPSFAPVEPDEDIVELLWLKGKLLHPVGRFFGGHHSVLVAAFASGQKVRIEKFGAGSVQYCPTREHTKCNLYPGDLFKSAGGRFLRANFTWRQLHAAMLDDLEHYDVVDSNCHHAVQKAWNAAVVSEAQDRTPAPDAVVLTRWEGFLRRWVSPEEEPEEAPAGRALSAPQLNASSLGQYAGFTTYGVPRASFDEYTARRRRRRLVVSQRCRGSSLEGDDNCPNRQSSMIEQSSFSGGPSCLKEGEICKKSRSQIWFKTALNFDKDFTGFKSRGQSDCKFAQSLSCGMEQDWSGSVHFRYQSSRPSSQSESIERSLTERMPMDPQRIEGNSKANDASSLFASELSHSQAQRSKGDNAEACNTNLGGVTADSAANSDFLCQWSCIEGNVTFIGPSTSTFICKDNPAEISLQDGGNEADCLVACAAQQDCAGDCVSKCRYLASSALDAGQANCVNPSGEVTSSGYQLMPLESRSLSPAAIILILLWFCCCCCCNVLTAKMKAGGEGGEGGGGMANVMGRRS